MKNKLIYFLINKKYIIMKNIFYYKKFDFSNFFIIIIYIKYYTYKEERIKKFIKHLYMRYIEFHFYIILD